MRTGASGKNGCQAWRPARRTYQSDGHFSAFAILFAAPVSIVYPFLQKYIVSGLAVGGVTG